MQNKIFDLICEGLQKKYSIQTGPIQEMEISFDNKNNIKIIKTSRKKKLITVDFIADLKEHKTIHTYYDEPVTTITLLNKVQGTLFVNDNEYEDLILEYENEAI